MDSLLHRIFGSFGPSQSVSDPYHWIARQQGVKTHAGIWVTETEAMKFSAVTACVQILSRLLAQLPIAVHRRLGPGSSEIARDHPLDRIISNDPNDWMSSYTWRETQQQHAVLWGNGLAEIERTVGGGKVNALWPMLPDRTRARIDTQSGRLVYDSHRIDGAPFQVNFENVLHIKGLSYDGLWGYSVIGHARQSIGLGLAAEEFGARFFGTGAKTGGFLQYPGKLTDARQENIEKSFRDKASGLEHAHEIKVLEEGMKWIPTTIPPDDAQFLQTRQFQVEDIARWFGVPLFMIQAHTKDTSWGTGVEQQMIGFLVVHQDSWLKKWEQELERKLLSPAEREEFFIRFNVEGLLRADARTKAEFLRTLVQGSMMTPNEARAKLDLPPDDNGDRMLLPKNIGFLDSPEEMAGTFGERRTDNMGGLQ